MRENGESAGKRDVREFPPFSRSDSKLRLAPSPVAANSTTIFTSHAAHRRKVARLALIVSDYSFRSRLDDWERVARRDIYSPRLRYYPHLEETLPYRSFLSQETAGINCDRYNTVRGRFGAVGNQLETPISAEGKPISGRWALARMRIG